MTNLGTHAVRLDDGRYISHDGKVIVGRPDELRAGGLLVAKLGGVMVCILLDAPDVKSMPQIAVSQWLDGAPKTGRQ